MIRLFRHYIPHAVLLLGAIDAALLAAAAETAWVVRAHQIGMTVTPLATRLGPLLSFVLAVQVAMVSVGVYGVDALRSVRFAAVRLIVAVALGVVGLAVLSFLVPGLTLWRSNALYAALLAPTLLTFARLLLGSMIGSDAFKRRVLVLGAGARAARLRSLAAKPGAGFLLCGFVGMSDGPDAVPGAIDRAAIASLSDHVVNLKASEVVLALQERRNALPLQDLLRIRTTGVQVYDIASFLERETGRIDLATANPSSLIFSDGFSSGRLLSSVAKRLFDIAASLILLVVAAPVILIMAVVVRLESPGPAFYRQRRVGLFGDEFEVIKLRSMRQDAEIPGQAVWAAENDPRITRVGRFIRKVRIDELPQIWVVLAGKMSFVGPRPERRQFVEALEQQLPYYAERHMVKPGITGWAQINYPYGASLDDARNKLEYDLYYAKNYTPFLDLLILLQTLRVLLWPAGAR
ncbi:TIGR03013 family XrtA/PEP-CTERM system glycosyltransferase [Sphingomonas morindae]|uniref:TIGR03013 family PEP-CTERM/XrtA system glycosyltransferase n=1 Tax=Sphingomonas morindae TaxID=1541170 RepID=A0ABY4XBI1_9SPHN|nr:TIGR03013 family XrtA/PEP-CTERM system glycosyltransferase [Sphingomonas morindae]USI74066.1 TIGR03013 family PEP-CTERM/XrtA system glycosyltransferase [Sphingomonas morindae]